MGAFINKKNKIEQVKLVYCDLLTVAAPSINQKLKLEHISRNLSTIPSALHSAYKILNHSKLLVYKTIGASIVFWKLTLFKLQINFVNIKGILRDLQITTKYI